MMIVLCERLYYILILYSDKADFCRIGDTLTSDALIPLPRMIGEFCGQVKHVHTFETSLLTPLFNASPMCTICCHAICGRSLRHVPIHGMARASLLCRRDIFFCHLQLCMNPSCLGSPNELTQEKWDLPDLICGRLLVFTRKNGKCNDKMIRCVKKIPETLAHISGFAEASFRRSGQTQANVFRLHYQEGFRIKVLSPP